MNKKELLRGIPKIDDVLRQEPLVFVSEEKGQVAVTKAARSVIDEIRNEILALKAEETDKFDTGVFDLLALAEKTAARLEEDESNNLYPVINATGTILHTNLGRAPLCRDAVENVKAVACGYSNLEYNVSEGKRGSRHDIVNNLIAELTGAEDAMVVNNNAAATMIVLAALGAGKEIIVSRSELVEIGGAFRIPDIMEQSGAYLQEVGCSNKTKVSDYENAIMTREQAEEYDPDLDRRGMLRFETGALMKVHKSNYDIVGFTEEASLEDLVKLGKKHDLPVIFDMGNGLMLDMSEYGLNEPNVPASLATGIDVILFSGDKLLGGPQAGIICGKKKYIKAMKKHPLARAMRVDKMTFAALEATLKKYSDSKIAIRDIPILNMIASSESDMKAKAEVLARMIEAADSKLKTEIVPVEDQIGGGSAPMVRLPGFAVSVTDEKKSAQAIERMLRKNKIPVIARIHDDRLLLCVRTLLDEELVTVADAFNK
ncbi:MAG: L-seryl-tRNA(Sec) selenium transferase [Clostridiales bacterium]|nr:L-seryl-tRNA(Sec) selenium transferase [Candidatus Crickella caballi]